MFISDTHFQALREWKKNLKICVGVFFHSRKAFSFFVLINFLISKQFSPRSLPSLSFSIFVSSFTSTFCLRMHSQIFPSDCRLLNFNHKPSLCRLMLWNFDYYIHITRWRFALSGSSLFAKFQLSFLFLANLWLPSPSLSSSRLHHNFASAAHPVLNYGNVLFFASG